MRGGTVTAAEGLEEADVTAAAELTTRVLALLAGPQPEAYSDLQWTHVVGNVYAVDVPVSEVEGFAQSSGVHYVEMGRGYGQFLESSIPETRLDVVHNPPAGQQAFTGDGVVVGIIDYGCDYRHDDFRNDDGTSRIAFLWDQDLSPVGDEASPAGYPHGVEYDQQWLNDALDGVRQVRHSPGVASHGTHVAGIAAGNGRASDGDFAAGTHIGAAPEATIIFVQPNTSDQDSSFTDSVHVTEAVAYIFERAAELGMPCVINMSLGQNGGSHDGESVVERAIDQLLEVPGRAFVSAAGNEHIWRGHSSGVLATDDTSTLRWKIGGEIPWPFPPFNGDPLPEGQIGDFTTNEMEIWFSSRDEVRVRLHSPNAVTEWVEPGESVFLQLGNDHVFIDSERFTVLNGDARIYIEISPPTGGVLLEGIWEVELEATSISDGRFHAFIERDARRHIIQFPGGQVRNYFADQSFFFGTDFDPQMTLGTPATARRSIAVANYNHNLQEPAPSSSRGPTRDGRLKPELAAPGTDIVATSSGTGQPGVPVRTSKTGTSMSAPHVAGVAALMLQKQPALTAEQIQAILVAAAVPPAGVDVFDNAWGFGTLDARTAVDLVDE